MSIKWYRGAGRRVLTPRIDKPKGPKKLPIKKPKKMGLPKAPGARKPRVRVPFVIKAGVARQNTSVAGLNLIKRLERENKMIISRIEWIRASSKANKNVRGPASECPNVGGSRNICDQLELRSKDWARDPWGQFVEAAKLGFPRTNGFGMWALSHINCDCQLRITMIGTEPGSDRRAVFMLSASTDPAMIDGSLSAKPGVGAEVDNSVAMNAATGLSVDVDLTNFDVKHVDVSRYTKFHAGDKDKVLRFIADNDNFGEAAGYNQKIKEYLEQPKIEGLAPGQGVGTEKVAPSLPGEEQVGEGEGEGPEFTGESLRILELLERAKKEEAAKAEKPASGGGFIPPASSSGPAAPGQ